ncbi:MAG: hypothetical protein RLZZ248_1936, partial [Bacteroidota bacterium]
WILGSEIMIEKDFLLNNGSLDSDDYSITINGKIIINGQGVADFGNSVVTKNGALNTSILNTNERKILASDATFLIEGGDFVIRNSFNTSVPSTNDLDFGNLIFFGFGNIILLENGFNVGFDSGGSLTFQQGGQISIQRFDRNTNLLVQPTILELAGGYNLTLEAGMSLSPSALISTGVDCSEISIIQSSVSGQAAFINLTQDVSFFGFKDIKNLFNNSITANESFDLGGNDRIIFNEIKGRKKYWVGGNGDWYDNNYWSFVPNGPGGVCPPTPLDTVIFTDFSFGGNNLNVSNNQGKNIFFHDLEDESSIGNLISLDIFNFAYAYGSVRLNEEVNFQIERLFFRSNDMNEVIYLAESPPKSVKDIYFNASGSWSALSNIDVRDIYIYDGNLDFGSATVNAERLYIRGSTEKNIELGNSNFYLSSLGDNWSVRADNTTITSKAGSKIFLNGGTTMVNFVLSEGNNFLSYNDVFFKTTPVSFSSFSNLDSDPSTSSASNFVTFNKVFFETDGKIMGDHVIDSLYFTSGKNYLLENGSTQEIKEYWFLTGSDCEGLTSLASDMTGSNALVNIQSSTSVISDYVQMQDIQITRSGNTNILVEAGSNSIDLGNNIGWDFGLNSNGSNGFLGPDQYLCDNQTIVIANPKSGIAYKWYELTGSNSPIILTGETQKTLSVTTAGRFIGEVEILSGCFAQDTIEIRSTDFLDSIDLGMDLTLCEGESQTFNINIPNYTVDFVWNDNPSNNLQNFTVSKPGQLKVEGTFEGCIRSDSIDITIDSVVTPTLPSTISLCFGEVINLPFDVSPYTLVEWEDPSGILSVITANELIINQGGTYNLKVYNNNCFKTTSVVVTAQPELVVNLGGNKILCQGESLELDAGNFGASFNWSGPISATSQKIQPGVSGNYKVEVTLNGCAVSDSVEVLFNPKPIVALDPGYVFCEGAAVTIQADNPLISSGANLTWSDGSNGNSISVNSAGKVILIADLNGCIAKDSTMVTMQTLPIINLSDQTLCEGESILLDATQGNSGTTYEWIDLNNMSLGTISTDPTLLVQNAGQYQITADIMGCQNSAVANIQFTASPVFDLGKDTVLCSGDPPISFDFSNVNGDSYLWSTNNTTALTQISSTGLYWLEIQKGSCIVRDSIQVVNQAKPTLNLSDQTLCAGDTFALDAGQSNPLTTYEWIDANNGNLLGTDPIYVVRGAGTYQITASILGCSSTQQVVATYNPIPTNLNLGPDTVLCEGQSLTFDQSNINADAYQWSNGDITPQIIVQPSLSTNYTLTITVNGCKASDAIQVDVQPFPILNLGNDTTMCDGELLVLDATQPYPNTNYDWQDISGGLPNALGSNPTLNVDQSGQFEITASVNGCSSSADVDVTFNPYPKLELGNDTTLCDGESIIVGTSILPTATYLWLDDNSTLPTRTLNQTGNYILQVTDNNCATTDSIEVEVIQFTPNFLGANQNNLCDGEQIDLKVKDTFPGITYLWNDGSTSSFLQVTQSGEYWVEINVDRCFIRDSIVFEFNPLPIFDLGLDQRLCEDETINLTITAGSSTFNWSDGTSQATNTIRYPGGLIWAEAQNLYCSFRDSIFVDYDEYPLIDLGPDTTICDDRSVILSAGANAEKFAWSTGSTASSVEVDKSGIYALTATNGVCEITDDVEVISRECYYFNVFVPNAFSPNNDGVNDNIVPYFPLGVSIQEFSMSILDRWGNILFQTNDINTTWDGYWNGQLMPGGVYIYYLEVSYVDDLGPGTARRNGDFILIK